MFKLSNKVIFPLTIFCSAILVNSCSLVKSSVGANIDAEQYDFARKAKISQIRAEQTEKLVNRLNSSSPIENTDMSFFMTEEALRKIAKQYENQVGWLDPSTSYTISKSDLNLYDGSAILTFKLIAVNNTHNVTVDLSMDAILDFSIKGEEIIAVVEPFNVAPAVEAGGILSTTTGIIENLVKKNLATMNKNFPPMKIPISFKNEVKLQNSNISIRDKVNLDIKNPELNLSYKLTLKEVLIFEDQAFFSVNLNDVSVK